MDREAFEKRKNYAGTTKESMRRRSISNDYSARRMYMITIVTEGRRHLFGEVRGRGEAPAGSADAPHMELSELGEAVQEQWWGIHAYYPEIEVMALQMMPDHLHGILFVRQQMKKPLGTVIRGFKTGCNRAFRRILPLAATQSQHTQQRATGTAAAAGTAEAGTAGAAAGTAGAAAAGTAGAAAAGTAEAAAAGTAGAAAGTAGAAAAGTAGAAAAGTAEAAAAGTAGAAAAAAGTAGAAAETAGAAAAGTTAAAAAAAARVGAPSVACVATQSQPKRDRRLDDREHGQLFELGYNDRILLYEGQLDRWRHYLSDNPRRLLLKREHPDLFRVRFGLTVAGHTMAAIGNRFLLDYPEKLQVQCSRRLSAEQVEQQKQHCLAEARRGVVLVSPSISTGEKAIMRAALDAGLPLIFLEKDGFTSYTKPGGQFFNACASGRLLILAPWEHHNRRSTITRPECLALNAMAKHLCENE